MDTVELRSHWRTAIGCMIAASIGTIGLYSYTTGVFVPTLIAEAGFTREQLSLATFVLSLSVAILAPLAGLAMDRFGALRVIAFAVAGEALAFAAFAFIPKIFAAYLAVILLLAVLGVGTTPLGFVRLITQRFDRARGIALGLAVSGLGLMAIFWPLVANRLIEAVGWRASFACVAVAVAFLGFFGLLLVSSDRALGDRPTAPAARSSREPGWGALSKPLFWVLLAGFLAPGLFGGGYLFHLVSILRERGVSPGAAAGFQSLIGVAVLGGRLGSGWALDRFYAPYVAAVTFLLSSLGCLALLGSGPILAALGALGVGVTVGSELDLMGYIFSRCFGLASFGRLYGLAYGSLIVCSGFSPVLITFLAQRGGYSLALIVSAIGTALGAALIIAGPRGRPLTGLTEVTASTASS